MRKQDLTRIVAAEATLTEAQALAAVNAVFSAVQGALANGDEVAISGFGTFRVTERAARQGRHPRTGDAMMISRRRSPAFRPGTQLKRAVGDSG